MARSLSFLSLAAGTGCAAFLIAVMPAFSFPMIGQSSATANQMNPLLVQLQDQGGDINSLQDLRRRGYNRGDRERWPNRGLGDRDFRSERRCDRWNDWCGWRRGRGGSSFDFSFGFGSPYSYGPGYDYRYPRYYPYRPRYTYRYGDFDDEFGQGIIGGLLPGSTYGLLGGSHYEWCRHRYRSYNPRTDMFLSYSGRYRHCNSPFD